MKKTIYKLIIISSLSFSALSAADDYSTIANDDFFNMRDQVRTMDDGSKDAYRTERQSRMMNMDQSERDSRFSDMGASGRKNMENRGQHSGQRKRDGSGGGQQKGKGQGGQSGGGNQYRYGQNSESSGGQRGGGGGRYGSGRL